jgi:glutaconyl-CoA/methylmalonyl-CoA decarboxylase subunit gamma
MKKTLRINLEGKSYDVEVEVLDSNVSSSVAVASVASAPATSAVSAVPAPVAAAPIAGGSPVLSPMMGLVFKVKAQVGDKVAMNQEVVVLEAMKMETPIYAPAAGTITSISVKEQESVSEGQVLMTIS